MPKSIPIFHLISLALISLTGFLIYSNSFQTAFQFDDYFAIVNNATIRRLDIPLLWDAFRTRFILGLSLAFNFHFSGLSTFGYHIFNLAIHLLAATSVYFFVHYLFQTPYFKSKQFPVDAKILALFSALLFVVHPIETQAVTYIWQRGASITALFYVAAVMFYLKARVESSKLAYGLCLISILLGMHTKENCATAPFAILMTEFFFFGSWRDQTKKRLIRLIPIFLCLFVIPLHMTRANEVQLDLLRSPLQFTAKSENLTLLEKLSMVTRWANPWDMPRKDYMLTQLNAVRTYLRLLFFPVNQNLDYDFPISKSLFEPATLFSVLLLILIFGLALWFYPKNRLLLYGVIWFYLNLLIESSVPMKDVFFEHRVYLPSVGFVLLVPYAFFSLIKQKKIVFSLLGCLVALFSVMTYQRNKVWKDELTLWHDVLKKSPNKARPYIELGAAYGRLGDMDKVIEMNTKAIERDPYRALAYGNIGYAYLIKKDLGKAIKFFHQAFLYQEYLPWVANNLSVAYRQTGRIDQAVYWSEKAVEQNPLLANSQLNLGNHYFLKGEIEKGIAACQKAIDLEPSDPAAYFLLGAIYLKLNQVERANEMIEALKKLNREDLVKQLEEGALQKGKDFF